MIDRTKAIITLIIAIAALIGFFIRHEHRMTVQEQCDIRIEAKLDAVIENQDKLINRLLFP